MPHEAATLAARHEVGTGTSEPVSGYLPPGPPRYPDRAPNGPKLSDGGKKGKPSEPTPPRRSLERVVRRWTRPEG